MFGLCLPLTINIFEIKECRRIRVDNEQVIVFGPVSIQQSVFFLITWLFCRKDKDDVGDKNEANHRESFDSRGILELYADRRYRQAKE